MDEPLLFVHGWATDNWVWEGVAEKFAGKRAVHNNNLPGHGGKKSWNGPTLAPAIAEVYGYISGLPERSVVGIGWSLGAEILIASALKDRKFKALVLAGATPSFVEKKDFPWGQSKALVKRMIMDMRKDPASASERFYRLNFTSDEINLPAARAFIERYRYPGPVSCEGEIPGCFPAFRYDEMTTALEALRDTDMRQGLGGLDIPVLIAHGEEDVVCPAGAARYLHERIKNSQLVLFRGAGHAPFLTQEKSFKEALDKFLAGI
ncbi:MAG: alpha/beta fold hydrolase [Deltaproteobacteria bacterium]|nr:alpha/beta fold hydrolase [Deltaproteobacteria bacterium]